MKDDKQTAVDWLYEQLFEYIAHNSIDYFYQDTKVIWEKAKGRYQDEMESVIIKQCATESTLKASSYSNGYKAGYERALELVKWKIDNELNTRPIKCQQ